MNSLPCCRCPAPPTPLERSVSDRLLLSELHTGRDRDEFSLSAVERKQLVFVVAGQISVIPVGSAFAGERPSFQFLKSADASNKLVLAPGEAVRT